MLKTKNKVSGNTATNVQSVFDRKTSTSFALDNETKNVPATRVVKSEDGQTARANAAFENTITRTVRDSNASDDDKTKTDPARKIIRQLRWEAEKRRLNILQAMLVGLAITFLFLLYQIMVATSPGSIGPKRTQEYLSSRVEHHKQDTGFRLNMGRAKAEAENFLFAPDLDPSREQNLAQMDTMDGLQLQPENAHRASPRDRAVEANPMYADSQIRKQVQYLRDHRHEKENVQEVFINEFVQNAKRAGYQVRVKKNLDVEVVRAPQNETPGKSGSSYGR